MYVGGLVKEQNKLPLVEPKRNVAMFMMIETNQQ